MDTETLPIIHAAQGADGWRTLARLLDRDTHPVGTTGTITLDAQRRPYWNFA